MPSLKRNLLYSILLVLANYVFPFLTYPYVSRVLGVTGIGACNFVDSVINYFILFSTLGIDSYGVREIAKHKDDKEALNRTFSNIFTVNVTLTAIMLVLLVGATLTVPNLWAHMDLMFIGAFKLVFNCLLTEWLFKGLEDFKLITLRSIAIKLLYVAAVFIFVRSREDVWVYYLASSMAVVVNALVNRAFARTRVHYSVKNIDFFGTFKSVSALGVYAILTSMYTTFNVMFLGFVTNDYQVGLYGTATKIYYIVMAVFSGFTGVMVPRMSSVAAAGDMQKFRSYFGMVVEFLFGFSIPIVAWMMLMAPDIIRIIAGTEFAGAVLPMTIIAPLVFVVGYEQILVLQTLLPLGKDRIMLRNSLIGAGVGITLNVLLVPLLAATGSAIVWIAVECLILILSQIAVFKNLNISFPLRLTVRNSLVYLPLIAILAACTFIPTGAVVRISVSVVAAAAYVLVYQLVIKKGQLLRQFN